MLYSVMWEIEIDADTPRDAAMLALSIQRDPASIAQVFTVWAVDGQAREMVDVDLLDTEPKKVGA